MTSRQSRMMAVVFVVVAALLASAFFLRGQSNLRYYFHNPSEVASGAVDISRAFRLGGMVKAQSVEREAGSMVVQFIVTDFANEVMVTYSGLLPDLFREGQGVVARGRLNQAGVFEAETILAKHDENYMPPEVAEALQHGQAAER